MSGLPTISDATSEAVEAEHSENMQFCPDVYKLMVEQNPGLVDAFQELLTDLADMYGEECRHRVCGYVLSLYYLLNRQIEINNLESL